MVTFPQPPVLTNDKYLKWVEEPIGNITKLVLYVYEEDGIWLRYTQSKYFKKDYVIPGKTGTNIASLGFATAQHCLKLGFKYDKRVNNENCT